MFKSGPQYNSEKKEDLDLISNIIDLKTDVLETIIKRNLKNKEKAYCPYSKFRVGCVLYTSNGDFIDGVNVENISYGLSICSERSALCSAISMGINKDEIKYLSVCTDREEFLTPCGACRQFIAEFPSIKYIVIVNNSGLVKLTTTEELLPFQFKCDL